LAGFPPLGVFPSLAAILDAAARRDPWLAVPVALCAAAAIAAIPRPARLAWAPRAALAWVPLALCAAIGFGLPALAPDWLRAAALGRG
jgi:formate hydrogenlyase subunit 3/multisubunit Na+/H+ antiporter MnhD subunit